jgi:hypothetical protein
MAVLAVWAVAAVVLLGGCGDSPTEGMTKDQVVAEYMTAVQAGDTKRLKDLSNPEDDPDAAISQKISSIGNRHWIDLQVTIKEGISPTDAGADITATATDGTKIADHLDLLTVDGCWYVSLGRTRS